jgi:hypothetical protein
MDRGQSIGKDHFDCPDQFRLAKDYLPFRSPILHHNRQWKTIQLHEFQKLLQRIGDKTSIHIHKSTGDQQGSRKGKWSDF